MMNIQRYDPTPGGTDGFVEKMNEVPDGGWIKHTDHIAALEASDAVWRNSVVDMHDRAMTAEAALEAVQATVKPVAYQYRWKLDGEWTNWRVSDASQKSPHLKDLEERPLYASQLIKTVTKLGTT